MYWPYSHNDQEGLQEPLNRHGGPAPAGGGILKEEGEENCSWEIFISVTVPLHFFSGSAGDGWARASYRLGSHSYTDSTFSFCLSVRWREVWGAAFIKLADTFLPRPKRANRASSDYISCCACLSCQHLKTEETRIKPHVPRPRWYTPTCRLPSTASTTLSFK